METKAEGNQGGEKLNAKDFTELKHLISEVARELKNDHDLGRHLIDFGVKMVRIGAAEIESEAPPEPPPKIFRIPSP
jgi:hypothetical protein